MRSRAAPLELALVVANVVAGSVLVVVVSQDAVRSDAAVVSAPVPSSGADTRRAVPVLVVVASDSPSDEIAGRSVAERVGGELLVLPRTGVTAGIAEDLSRLRSARVLILGGVGTVTEANAAALARYTSGPVTRVAGDNRYETAARAATLHFTGPVERLRIVSGEGSVESPAVARVAASDLPVLLVEINAIPSATATALGRLRPRDIEVVGGRGAVSEAVLLQLRDYASGDVSRALQD